jgi:hypothetical protein
MPAVLVSPQSTVNPGGTYRVPLGANTQISNIGVRINSVTFPRYRRFGWLFAESTFNTGTIAFAQELSVGAIWVSRQQFRLPQTIGVEALVYRADAKYSGSQLVQFYYVSV